MYHNRTSFFYHKAGLMAISVKPMVYDTIVHSNCSKPIQHLPDHLHFLFRNQLYYL